MNISTTNYYLIRSDLRKLSSKVMEKQKTHDFFLLIVYCYILRSVHKIQINIIVSDYHWRTPLMRTHHYRDGKYCSVLVDKIIDHH